MLFMKLIVKKQMMCLAMLILLFVGCGADEDELFEISDKTPVVSIEKVSVEINEDAPENEFPLKYAIKVVSDSKVKTDLLVKVAIGHRYFTDNGCDSDSTKEWLTIQKGQNESENITSKLRAEYLNGTIGATIVSLPLINIVGEGEVIDQDLLQTRYGGETTFSGQTIPEKFVFPAYKVKNPDSIIPLYQPKNAKIVDIEHPSGTQFLWSSIPDNTVTVTFDTPPECPEVYTNNERVILKLIGSGKQFDIRFSYLPYPRLNSYIDVYVTLKWSRIWNPEEENSEELIYRFIRNND